MAVKVGISLKSSALKKIDELRAKLRDAEETLSAIQSGEVDALVISSPTGQQIYTLKGAEQPYRVLVESMNEGALTLSETGVILYCNARFAAMIGCPLERVMGQRFDAFLPKTDARSVEGLLKTTDRSGSKLTISLVSPKGEVPAQLSLIRINLDGMKAYCAIATDLSEAYAVREAILQKEAGLRLIAEAAPVVLFTCDSSGNLTSAAGGGLKTLRNRVQQLLSTPASSSGMSLQEIQNRSLKDGQYNYDVALGERVWNITLEPMRRGNINRGFIGVALDVTAQRQEREMIEMKRRDTIQREFVANVSHEFRTPLSVIQAYTETLLRRKLNKTPIAGSFLRTIERHSQRLTGLVDNLLFLSSTESGRLKPIRSVIDVNQLLQGLVEDIKPIATRGGIAVSLEMPPGLKAFVDGEHIRRVMQNILSNAIKYNRKGGKLMISAGRTNGRLRLKVTDTGIGIDPTDLPRIFERFHRASNARSQSIKGTGLGLSIAKTLVEGNGGQIWVESDLGRGSQFHILLPLQSSSTRGSIRQPPELAVVPT